MKKLFLLVFIVLFSVSAFATTEYTGDVFMGKKVVSKLDVSDLEKGKTHELFFRAADNIIGYPYLIPVTVIKGKKDGKKFLINTGVHGDELNSIMVVNDVKEALKKSQVSGTIVLVHMLNIPGVLNNTRDYTSTGMYNYPVNLNRGIDALKDKNADQLYSKLVWENLLLPNADYALDIHTGGATKFPYFVYTTQIYNDPYLMKMTDVLGVDIVKLEMETTTGTVDEGFLKKGIPAITVEVGSGNLIETDYVKRAVVGIMNNLALAKIIENKIVTFEKSPQIINEWYSIPAMVGGMVKYHVTLGETVKKDQLLAVSYDAFGNISHEYKSPADGVVASLRNYPFFEKGSSLGRIGYFDEKHPQPLR